MQRLFVTRTSSLSVSSLSNFDAQFRRLARFQAPNLSQYQAILHSPLAPISQKYMSTSATSSTVSPSFTAKEISAGLQLTLHQMWEMRLQNQFSPSSEDLITIQGWVRSVRSQKGVVFITINDGSNVVGMQVVFEENSTCSIETVELAKKATLGSSLSVTGHLVRNLRNAEDSPDAYELLASTFSTIGECLQPDPATSASADIEAKRAAKKAAKEASRLASLKAKEDKTDKTDKTEISSSDSTNPSLNSFIPLAELAPENFPLDDASIMKMAAETLSLSTAYEPILSPYPLQKKYTSLAHLREFPHLRARTNTYASVLRMRSAATHALHDFFRLGGYFSVQAPVLTPLDCEGAGEMFSVTTDVSSEAPQASSSPSPSELLVGVPGTVSPATSFFNSPAYLSVSGQLYAEIAAASVPRVYSFGPTFRAENSHTTRHLAEFWMLEPEIAFAENSAVMDQCERSVKFIVSRLFEQNVHDISFLSSRQTTADVDDGKTTGSPISTSTKTLVEKLEHTRDADFARITYTDAVELLLKEEAAGKVSFLYPLSWGVSLQSEHERYLAEIVFTRPVFITNYPASIKPFYMFVNPTAEEFAAGLIQLEGKSMFHGIDADLVTISESEERRTVACFDLIVPGIGELCGGSQREHRYQVLLERMRASGLDLKPYQWYLDLRRFGSVPHGGWGMGFERFLAYATGMENVRDTTLVPRAPNLMQM